MALESEAISNPITVIGISVAAVTGLVASVKILANALAKKKVEESRGASLGDMNPDYLVPAFKHVEELVKDGRKEQIDAMRDLTRAINELTNTLLRPGR